VQCRFDFDDTRLSRTTLFDVLLDDVDAFDYHPVSFREALADDTALPFVATVGNQHFIAGSNLPHHRSLQRFRSE
jgi:hypothetical protein